MKKAAAHTMIVTIFSTSNCCASSSRVMRLTSRRAIRLANHANTRTPTITALTISTSNNEMRKSPSESATLSTVSMTEPTVSLCELSASLAPSAAATELSSSTGSARLHAGSTGAASVVGSAVGGVGLCTFILR